MNRRAFLRSAAAATAVTPFLRFGSRPDPLRVNGARLNSWLARLDSIGRTPGGINRVAYSDADLAGRAFTLDLFREAGLNPRIDTAGNIGGLLPGTDPSLPPILIGSHVDSVTDGGNYDGPVGSFGALAVARSLREQGTRLRHPPSSTKRHARARPSARESPSWAVTSPASPQRCGSGGTSPATWSSTSSRVAGSSRPGSGSASWKGSSGSAGSRLLSPGWPTTRGRLRWTSGRMRCSPPPSSPSP